MISCTASSLAGMKASIQIATSGPLLPPPQLLLLLLPPPLLPPLPLLLLTSRVRSLRWSRRSGREQEVESKEKELELLTTKTQRKAQEVYVKQAAVKDIEAKIEKLEGEVGCCPPTQPLPALAAPCARRSLRSPLPALAAPCARCSD